MSLANEKCEKPFGLEEDLRLSELLRHKEYSLNAVNHYGDNLLHVGAANGCVGSVKIILNRNKCSGIDRKNKFGWTPLMHAIRANEHETVEALLKRRADVTQRNYLGVSTLSLAAGVGQEMFEMIRNACPSMLKISANDDVTPLCVAAMKNDEKLFRKLIDLGLELKNENTYTHLAMQRSTIPEIRSLASPPPEIQEYWNDRSDDIPLCGNGGRGRPSTPAGSRGATNAPPLVRASSFAKMTIEQKTKSSNGKDVPRGLKLPSLDVLSLKESHSRNNCSISPNLIYNRDSWFDGSPDSSGSRGSPDFAQLSGTVGAKNKPGDLNRDEQRNRFDPRVRDEPTEEKLPPIALQRAGDNLTFDSTIEDRCTDHNASLSFAPEFSPSRSPRLPSDFEDEDVCGVDTPTPPHYKTPPQGMVLNSDQAKLVITLRQFDLEHHIGRFLAEEVDMSLFLTLNDRDLTEIGIQDVRDREALLAVIDGYTKNDNT